MRLPGSERKLRRPVRISTSQQYCETINIHRHASNFGNNRQKTSTQSLLQRSAVFLTYSNANILCKCFGLSDFRVLGRVVGQGSLNHCARLCIAE